MHYFRVIRSAHLALDTGLRRFFFAFKRATLPISMVVTSKDSQEDHFRFMRLKSRGLAIDDLIAWYCSEPRLAFNKTVVLRYRIQLESKQLAPSTINLGLAAVRRLAYEAADVGLLSPDLAASIRRVKGATRLGVRLGNWLTAEQAKA